LFVEAWLEREPHPAAKRLEAAAVSPASAAVEAAAEEPAAAVSATAAVAARAAAVDRRVEPGEIDAAHAGQIDRAEVSAAAEVEVAEVAPAPEVARLALRGGRRGRRPLGLR
jgi:hypothetical protein